MCKKQVCCQGQKICLNEFISEGRIFVILLPMSAEISEAELPVLGGWKSVSRSGTLVWPPESFSFVPSIGGMPRLQSVPCELALPTGRRLGRAARAIWDISRRRTPSSHSSAGLNLHHNHKQTFTSSSIALLLSRLLWRLARCATFDLSLQQREKRTSGGRTQTVFFLMKCLCNCVISDAFLFPWFLLSSVCCAILTWMFNTWLSLQVLALTH